jgi:hypothetical protein
MKFTLPITAAAAAVVLTAEGISAHLRAAPSGRNLLGNSGTCQLFEFTRQLEFGPVVVPLPPLTPPVGGIAPLVDQFRVVSQKSKLCDGSCDGNNQIGSVYATATVIEDSRIGQGGYTFDAGDFGIGTILFEGIVANSDLGPENNAFEVAIIGGTEDFRCAQGWIRVGESDLQEPPSRKVTVNVCPAKCKEE